MGDNMRLVLRYFYLIEISKLQLFSQHVAVKDQNVITE